MSRRAQRHKPSTDRTLQPATRELGLDDVLGSFVRGIKALPGQGLESLRGLRGRGLGLLDGVLGGLRARFGAIGRGGAAVDNVAVGVGRVADGLRAGNRIPTARRVRNAHLAGDVHPATGIPFDAAGFPDFSAVAKMEVRIVRTGSRRGDIKAANDAAGLTETPLGYTWHHHQDGETMQLIPTDVHRLTGHTGGFSLHRAGDPE
jgi:hypothetical protein